MIFKSSRSRIMSSPLKPRAFLVLFLAWAAPAAASELAGTVLDAAAKPVAGVTVSAIGRTWADPVVTATARTGPDGRFVLAGAWKLENTDLPYLGLFARAPDGRCGWMGTVWGNEPASRDVTIRLEDPSDVAARLVDQDGKPLAGAEVIVQVLDRSDPERQVYDQVVLPASLEASFRARSDLDGRFRLRGIPRGVNVKARVDEPAVGRPSVFWDPAKVQSLVLDRRLGAITGRLATPDGKEIPGKVTISLRRNLAAEGLKLSAGDFSFTTSRSTTVDRDGRFQIAGLPPGGYFVELEFDAATPYSGEHRRAVVLEPGEPFKPLEIPLQRWPVVSGRVIDEVTGSGILGVGLTAYQLQGYSMQYGRRTKTDSAGNYVVAVQPGMTMIHPHGPPKAFLGMYQELCPRLEVKADRAWPDLKLGRATTLEGRVLDASGKPVAGAEIRATVPEVSGFRGNQHPLVSSDDGSYRVEQLDPTDKVPVRARTADATTEGPVVILPSDLKPPGKLDLVVDPKFAARLTGRVVDQRGKPVVDAPVLIWWNHLYYSVKVNKGMGLGQTLDQVKTGPDGRFRTRALWPGDRYHVTVDFKPYAKAETPQVMLSPGQTHDVGTIALVESSAALAGVVVGSDGKPIAGAEVFNRGDGPQPVSTRTGPDGRFRLEGLYSGSKFAFARRDGFRYGSLAEALKIAGRKYLFVRKEGYRFGGLAVDGEPQDLTIRLIKLGENPPPWKPNGPPSVEEQQAFAKRVLERLWKSLQNDRNPDQNMFLVELMAAIDPVQALTWSAGHNHRWDQTILEKRAERLAATDAAAAARLVMEQANRMNMYYLQGFAERCLESDPNGAALLAEEAAKEAQGSDGANRASALARAGSVLYHAGRRDPGRKLIEEAADLADKLPNDEQAAFARGISAKAIAPLDSKRAMALIEPIKKRDERDRYTGFIIDALSASNPDQALALVETIDSNSSLQQTLKTGIAFAIAPSQPDRAVQIVEGIKGFSPEKFQAEAFGWLATAIAPRERGRAFALIDRALALPIDKPEAFGSWTYFGGGLASAAGIALNARKIGDPEMESVMLQVMAARPDGRHGFNDPAMQAQCMTIAAPLVALLDPAAAATVLGQIEARSGLSPVDLANVAGEWWLAAWALADLKHAEGIADAQLEALKTSKNPAQILRSFRKMIEVLIIPPDRREETLRREIGSSWRPEFSTSD
jgi:hypothetical protein